MAAKQTVATGGTLEAGRSELAVTFLVQGEQRAEDVGRKLAGYIAGAEKSLDLALYDVRFTPPQSEIFATALAERAAAGVAIRIAYDADKPEEPLWERGIDPAPGGTGAFIQGLEHPWRRIGGRKLMHHKYIVRDADLPGARVWTGSTNMTDDGFALQENNIVEIASAEIAGYYRRNFEEMWREEDFEKSGRFDTREVELLHDGETLRAHLLFSPGRGPAIDYEVARRVARARRRVRICSMLLNSGALLAALTDVLREGRVTVDGIYDGTQMRGVLHQWRDVPQNRWKIAAVEDIVEAAELVGKKSTPYQPDTPHDFMHNKVLVVDDTVITGSYNFSHSAELNAENILLLDSPALAERYSRYIDHLIEKYRDDNVKPYAR
jgi:phosphatidylserine/phosphatidylglycerophosphate/cardiolipin synthase-like enzyme